MGATVSVINDAMFRGRSLSAGRPVGQIAIAVDGAQGFYAGATALGVASRDDGAQFLGAQEYAGHAWRLRPGLTLDTGVINTNYSHYWSGGRAAGYTEVYAGLIGRRLSTHLSLSPNYYESGRVTGYGDVDLVLLSRGDWQLNAHAGLFVWIAGGRPARASATHYDWQVGVTRRIGRLEARLAWTGGGPDQDYYAGRPRHRAALVARLACSF